MNIDNILLKYYGYTSFRSGQKEIITAINNNKNVLAVLPTGGGKSLCYQIPALMSKSFSIVISPLIALMQDQVDALNREKTIAAFINSTQSYSEIEETIYNVSTGEIKLLYLAPEKLENSNFAERIKSLSPSKIFIDEAHCISQWGHNFRPSYRNIKQFCEFVDVKEVSAFTATATEEVRKDIIEQLGLKDPIVYIKGFERHNLFINAEYSQNKKERTLQLLNLHDTPAIVYTSTRKNAEELSDYLKLNNIDCNYYHAGLSKEMRRIIQDDFLNNRLEVIIATNAFGMGIDKSDIRLLIHFNMPGSIESYYQEIGRAGRDGKDSHVYLLYDSRDKYIQEFFIQNAYLSLETLRIIYSSICDYGKVALGNAYSKPIPLDQQFTKILQAKNISKSMISTAVNILAEANYLQWNSGFENNYKAEFNLSHEQLKNYVKRIKNYQLKEIILILIKVYGNKLFNNKTELDIDEIINITGMRKELLVDLLDELSNIGIINFDKPVNSQSVTLNGTRVREESIIVDYENINRNREAAQKKLDSIINLCYSKECRFKVILNYFGEDSNYSCGKCDNCLGNNQKQIDEHDYLKEIIISAVKNSESKYTKLKLIKILRGIEEGAQARVFPSFGSLTNYNNEQIESVITDLISKGLVEIKNEKIILRKMNSSTNKKKEITNNDESSYEEKLELFNSLRTARKLISQKFGQTPELICSDNILKNIALKKPSTHSELLLIKGFNRRMYNKFGEEILSIIKKNNKPAINEQNNKAIPKTLETTLKLINKGYNFEEIVKLQKLPESVASLQIETLIGYFTDLNISNIIDDRLYNLIADEYKNGNRSLNEIKSALPSNITFSKIRIVVAKLKKEMV